MENRISLDDILKNDLKKTRVAFLGSYPPRECGIATYSKDLIDSISRLKILKPISVVAINEKGGHYNYQRTVKFQIEQEDIESYGKAAEHVNSSDADLVHL